MFRLHANGPEFGRRIDRGLVESNHIDEASGIAASQKNANVLWTHNDSGDQSRVFALDTEGKHLGVYFIEGVDSRDWEDIAIGPGPLEGESYLYIGNIGDNEAQNNVKYIYRIPEPAVDATGTSKDTTISGVETIAFQYPDGNRDAEALMIDSLTNDLYVVSKREDNVRVYRAPYPQSLTRTITLEHVATLNLENVVAGDISPSGLEILLKTYNSIYYWCRTPKQKLWQVFDEEPFKVPYVLEPQGEAVGWESNGRGYYTISEELANMPAHLYYYPQL